MKAIIIGAGIALALCTALLSGCIGNLASDTLPYGSDNFSSSASNSSKSETSFSSERGYSSSEIFLEITNDERNRAIEIADCELIQSAEPRLDARFGSSYASPESNIRITFTREMDTQSLNDANIIVTTFDRCISDLFDYVYDPNTKTLYLNYKKSAENAGSGDVVFVYLTTRVKTADGVSLDTIYFFQYCT